MFCNHCGAPNLDTAKFCVKCGQEIQGPAFSGGVPSSHVQPLAAPPMSVAPSVPQTSGLAIGSLICGILGIFFPAAIGAIIMGHLSRSEIKKSQGRLKGAGMALAGMILGYVFICFIPFLIIAAIAIPNLLRARIAANEASAVGSIRTVVKAEFAYAERFPQTGFVCSLKQLGGRGGSPEQAGLIDNALASGQKSGYVYELSGCEDDSPHKRFAVVAYPKLPGQSGQRGFCADESGVIRYLRYERSGSPQECLEVGSPL